MNASICGSRKMARYFAGLIVGCGLARFNEAMVESQLTTFQLLCIGSRMNVYTERYRRQGIISITFVVFGIASILDIWN